MPLDTRVWVAAKLYSAIQMYFAHAEGAPEFDLDRDYRDYLKAAFAADDRRQFDLATIAFMGKLRNGHSMFYDTWLNEHFGQELGFAILPMPEGWVVMYSRVPNLNPGDVVSSVDGKPMEQFYRQNDQYLEGSSELARKRKMGLTAWLWPASFELGLADGRTVAIRRREQKLEAARGFPSSQSAPAMPDGVGYVRIRSFEQPQFEAAAIRQVKALKDAKAIVFDVRDNGGGSTPTALLTAVLDRTWRDFRYTTPLLNGHVGAENQIRKIYPQASSDPYVRGYLDAFEEFRDAQMLTIAPVHPPAPDAFKGKVYVLINGFCGSACDDFAEAFKTSGRGVLIGEATNGSSGQPYYFDFGNGMSFRVSSKRYYLPDGGPFEGVGIRPDVEVLPSLADLKAGRDPVFDKAIELAKKN